jgi:hypothetical protein
MAEKSVYDMSDEEYDRLEQNALVRWRVAYPKTATEADNEAAASYCTDSYSASDMAEAYTDGYRTGYLCAESSSAGAAELNRVTQSAPPDGVGGCEAAAILRELWAVQELDEPDFARMSRIAVSHAKWIEKHGAFPPPPATDAKGRK